MSQKSNFSFSEQQSNFLLSRRDIVDRNGIIISRNINTFHVAVDPKLVSDKKNFLIKLRLNFPDLPFHEIKRKLDNNKYFRIKTRITQNEKNKYWSLGEKAIKFEPF